MQQLPLRAGVRYQQTRHGLARVAQRFVRDDRGEMGSWLILAAGLAIAAVAAVGLLDTWFTARVGDITNNSAPNN